MKEISTTHSIIPAQPGYTALFIVTDAADYPCEWFTAPIIAWAVHVTLENNKHSCLVDPICDADDQVASVWQRPDGNVVIPHGGEYPDPKSALKYMQADHERTEQMRRDVEERRNSSSD